MDLFTVCAWKHPEDGVLYRRFIAKKRVYDFLAGLHQELDEVFGHILGLKPLPVIDEVFDAVRREETRRKVMLTESPSPSPSLLNDTSALIARGSDTQNDG